MKNTVCQNLLGQFLIYKNQSLGKGATGEVYLGKNLNDNLEVAVKIIDTKTIDNEVTHYLLEMQKIALMAVCNPYVLQGIKVIQNKSYCYLITQLCKGGSLKELIRKQGPQSEAKTINWMIEILKGQCSLIGKGIIHRDMKPANILLHNDQIKIIDFGYCEIKGYKKPDLDYNVGSPSYMAPQSFLDNIYNEKTEIWAVGVILYECLNGKTFDDGRNMGEVYKQIKKNGLPYRVEVSEVCKKAIKWCLDFDPKKRPTCIELLSYLIDAKNKQLLKLQEKSAFEVKQNVQPKIKLASLYEKFKYSHHPKNFNSNNDENYPKKIFQMKIRPVLSTYQPKIILTSQAKFQSEKNQIQHCLKSKYRKSVWQQSPSNILKKQRSKIISSQSVFATDEKQKQYSKQKNQQLSKMVKIESRQYEKPLGHRVNYDYYGTLTSR